MKTNADSTPYTNWGIKRLGNGRFVIIDTSTEDVLDECEGHGFVSYNSAYSYGYNRYHNKGQCHGEPNKDEFNTLI